MARMFKKWSSLLVCLFLPSTMISFLHYKNQFLQMKIAHSLQPDPRVFTKALPADDPSMSALQRLGLTTPFYRVDRQVDDESIPMMISGMTSRMISGEVMQRQTTTKQTITTRKPTITTRAAVQKYPLPESQGTVNTAERNVKTSEGDSVHSKPITVKPQIVIEKRPSRRSRRTRRTKTNIVVKPQEPAPNVGVEIPVKSIEVVGKSDGNQIKSTSAPGVKTSSLVQGAEGLQSNNVNSSNTIAVAPEVPERQDNPTFMSPVESGGDTVQKAEAATIATKAVPSTSKTITEIAKKDLANSLVHETSLDKSVRTSDGDKSAEVKITPAPAAPSVRKTTKLPVKPNHTESLDVEQVGNNQGKISATVSDNKIGIVQNKTDSESGMIKEKITERNHNETVKPSLKKDESKRNRKSKARRKSDTKVVKEKVPMTFHLNFNLNDSQSPVILASTNKAFLNFTDNWLESLKRSGITSGVTLVAEDHEAFNYLNSKTDIDLNVVLNDVSESSGERLPFDSPAYKKLVNKRPSYILQLLSNGHDVLFSDVDIVWLKNPLSYFTNDNNDIWLQEDLHEPTVYCAGFTFYRSKPATIALVTEWVQTLALHPTYPDQRALNGLLKKERWQGDNLHRDVMDSKLFPSGLLYFDPKWREANKDIEQVIVHNNWIKGYDLKVERFKNEGLWYLDDKETKHISK